MILRARILVPVSRSPIENGAVVVREGKVVQAGSFAELADESGPVMDLGESVLFPGLVNAHCHLDYTLMAGQTTATRRFSDWIKSITTLKASWSYSEYAESWLAGAQMLLQNGTTLVGDIEAVPELLPDVWASTPLRVHSFFEMTGVKSRREPREILHEAVEKIESLPQGRCVGGLSPHAPYSTTPQLLKLAAAKAREKQWRVSIHVAESLEEQEMFLEASGTMYEWLKKNNREMTDCGQGSPVAHLAKCQLLGPEVLAIHANYLSPGDLELLVDSGTHIVHCPSSHLFFQHDPFPYDELENMGVNICLGTDSLASQAKPRGQPLELNLFEEMRIFLKRHRDVKPEVVFFMATMAGARALGLTGQCGEISPGAAADFGVIPFSGQCKKVYESLVQHPGRVSGLMIEGEWITRPEGIS